jgi:hypothetical protein
LGSLFKYVKKHPISGIGYNRFAAEYNDWQAKFFIEHPNQNEKIHVADNVQVAYNEFLQTAVETGIIGILLVVSILTTLTVKIVRKFKERTDKNDVMAFLVVSGFSGFIAILSMCMFSYPLQCTPVCIVFIMLIGLLNSKITSSEERKSAEKEITVNIANHFYNKAAFIMSIMIVSVLITYNVSKINCYTKWKEAVNEYNNQNYAKSASIYQEIYSKMKDNGLFLLYYGTALVITGDCEQGKKILEEAKVYISDPIIYLKMGDCYRIEKNYSAAEFNYKYANAIIPGRLYPKYLLALLYEEQGNYCDAMEYAQNILNTKEKIRSAAIDEMKDKMTLIIKKYNCDKQNIIN